MLSDNEAFMGTVVVLESGIENCIIEQLSEIVYYLLSAIFEAFLLKYRKTSNKSPGAYFSINSRGDLLDGGLLVVL